MNIKELAKLAKVSTTSVSQILNNKPIRISNEKRELIIRLAKEYHYSPNVAARNLASKKTNIVALIIPDIENPFFSKIAKLMEEKLRTSGYDVIYGNSNESIEMDIMLLNLFANKGVDAIFITVSNDAFNHLEKYQELISSLNIPTILLDRILDENMNNYVTFDHEKGQYNAVIELINLNHKEIGYISGPFDSHIGKTRLNGYLRAIREHGLNEYVYEGEFKFKSGFNICEKILANPVTAIACANDLIAFGAIKKLLKLNKSVPKDISITGYDNIINKEIAIMEIDTIEQDIDIMIEAAVNMLLKTLDKNDNNLRIKLETKYIKGESIKSF